VSPEELERLSVAEALFLRNYAAGWPALPSAEASPTGRGLGDDRACTGSHPVQWLVTDVYGYRGEERAAFVRAGTRGCGPRASRTEPPCSSAVTPR